jgi:uncharacterized membrane protein YjgN (DUF898 family)
VTFTRQKFLKSEKFSKAFLILGHFEVAFILMDLIRGFSYVSLQNTLFNVSELDDMHALLSDLKYKPPFHMNLLCCMIDDILLFFI